MWLQFVPGVLAVAFVGSGEKWIFYHACRVGGCSWYQTLLLDIGVRTGDILPRVQEWKAARGNEGVGPKLHLVEAEVRIQRDIHRIGERVLSQREKEDSKVIVERTRQATGNDRTSTQPLKGSWATPFGMKPGTVLLRSRSSGRLIAILELALWKEKHETSSSMSNRFRVDKTEEDEIKNSV